MVIQYLEALFLSSIFRKRHEAETIVTNVNFENITENVNPTEFLRFCFALFSDLAVFLISENLDFSDVHKRSCVIQSKETLITHEQILIIINRNH